MASRHFLKMSLILALMLMPSCVSAQISCDTRENVVAKLTEKYGEQRIGGGLVSQVEIFEIWTSEETGTWTILRMTPNGLACAMAAGTHWRSFEEEATHENTEEIH